MTEFQEVMKQWQRLCKAHGYCEDCPLGWQCLFNVNYNGGEETIMKWAKEHPEPVYPTWQEWFETFDEGIDVDEPIPADIANKLGIKPKE